MRSTRAEMRRPRRVLAGLLLAASLGAGAQPASPAAGRASAVEAAASALRADPLLSGTRKVHTLEWKHEDKAKKKTKEKPEPPPGWLDWLRSFIRFLNDTSRLLVYGLAAVLVALLLVSVRHFVQLRGPGLRRAGESAVSHVRDLDVRPESLPDDVGAAAWGLWQAGQVPAALSLLYRGALSRLIHRHAVPIDAATTEGECLVLARERVDDGTLRYLTQLVRAREANTYGGRDLSAAMGESLCGGFASRLDAPAPTPATTEAAP